MHAGDELPTIGRDASIAEAIMQMTQSRLGMCAVLDAEDRLIGIVTDGDLRRHVDELGDIRSQRRGEHHDRQPANHSRR